MATCFKVATKFRNLYFMCNSLRSDLFILGRGLRKFLAVSYYNGFATAEVLDFGLQAYWTNSGAVACILLVSSRLDCNHNYPLCSSVPTFLVVDS